MKKISIIIPTLNSSLTILNTLKSVLSQTYKNWEIIIIDGGSTDSTVSKIKNLNIKNCEIFNFSKNKTLSSARYFGVMQAKGDLIAFLDSDDTWHKNKLYEQYIFLITSKYQFISTNYIVNSSKGNYINNLNKKTLSLKDLIYERPIALSSVLINRKILIKFMKKNLEINYAEDFCLWVSILKSKYKCIFLNKKYTIINLHRKNRSKNFWLNIKSLVYIYRNKLKYNYIHIMLIFSILVVKTFKKNIIKFKSYNEV